MKKCIYKFIIKTFITIILVLIILILFKKSSEFKANFYSKVYDSNFTFAKVNELYTKYFGSSIPFKNLISKDESNLVFNELLNYKTISKYKDGAQLELSNDLLPVLEDGLVVFVGEKENYGKTIIIDQIDGIELWYCNLDNINVSLYDYVEKGSLIGNTNNRILYLVYKKDGKVLNYEDYI